MALNEIIAGIFGILAVAVIFTVSQKPKPLVSNFVEWLRVFGIDLPHWLEEERADYYARRLALSLFAGALLVYFVPAFLRRDAKTIVQQQPMAAAQAGQGDRSENLKRVSNKELRERTTALAAGMRTFKVRSDQEVSAQWLNRPILPQDATEEQRSRDWRKYVFVSEKLRSDQRIEFINRFRPDASALRDELLYRIKMKGLVPPNPPGYRPERPADAPNPDENWDRENSAIEIADYLEKMTRLLKD